MKIGEWTLRQQIEENAILDRLFMRLLPVQVAIIAMGSINAIIDGVIAARYIDISTVGVIGLYYTMLRILEASGSVILGGVTVLSGKYMGSGRVDKTRGIISLGLALSFLIGAFLTTASFAVPGLIADMLGANKELKDPLCTYIMGYAIGILPQLLGQQFAYSLQLERKEKLGHIAVAVMICCNVVMDLLLVVVLNMGILGLVLATSAANWAYFLVVAFPYMARKVQLLPSLKLIEWKETGHLVKIGFPAALLVACLAVRSMIINRLLLSYSGVDSLSALSAYNLVSGLILAIGIGSGSLTRMFSAVFIGEDNREGLKGLIKFIWTYVMILMIAVGVLVIILAPFLSSVFFEDTSSEVYRMTKQLFVINGIGVPVALACINFSSYFQAAGHLLFANFVSVMDGVVSTVIPALILAPLLGELGVWLSLLIGLFITLGCSVLYPIIRCRRIPQNLDEWMLLPPEFGSEEHLLLHIHETERVTETAIHVQEFCDQHGMAHKKGYYAGLCLEEIAYNIVQHGFHADKRRHTIEVRVIYKSEGDVILRIKDDCQPFNPQEWYTMTSVGDDPFTNIGIRLVYGIADEVEYMNMLGLNVLTIQISG